MRDKEKTERTVEKYRAIQKQKKSKKDRQINGLYLGIKGRTRMSSLPVNT